MVRFNQINYNGRPYIDVLTKIAKEKTSLRYSEIVLLFDFFVFFIRKTLVEKKCLRVINFAYFYVKWFRSKRGNVVRIKNFPTLKLIINSKKNKFASVKNQCHPFLRKIAICFSVPPRDIALVFNIFFYGICQVLIENEIIRIRNFGYFYIQDRNYKKERSYKKKDGSEKKLIVKNLKWVVFKPLPNFKKELQEKSEEFQVPKRLDDILNFYKIDKKIIKTFFKKVYNRKRRERQNSYYD
jgi:nucleoid DNA-binding protein